MRDVPPLCAMHGTSVPLLLLLFMELLVVQSVVLRSHMPSNVCLVVQVIVRRDD